MAATLFPSPVPTKPYPSPPPPPPPLPNPSLRLARRRLLLAVLLLPRASPPPALALPPPAAPRSAPSLPGVASTRSWPQFFGDGFSLRVPPLFDDLTDPDDPSAGLSLYGDRAKPRRFAARFASPDRSELLTVIVRPSNQLRITFLEARDVADLGSLKSAAPIFVPAGATLYAARTIRVRQDEDEGIKNYYLYEFGLDEQRVALVAAVSSGKTIVAAATAPLARWEKDGVKLRSAAVSLSVL